MGDFGSVPPKKADEGKDKDKDKDAAEAALNAEARLANAVRDTKASYICSAPAQHMNMFPSAPPLKST